MVHVEIRCNELFKIMQQVEARDPAVTAFEVEDFDCGGHPIVPEVRWYRGDEEIARWSYLGYDWMAKDLAEEFGLI